MKTLIFDRAYLKFPPGLFSGDEVRLLEVFKTQYEDLHDDFVQYDTVTYRQNGYRMPKTGDALVLLLIFGTELFTTVRKHTNEKEEYFRSLRGSNLVVKIGE